MNCKLKNDESVFKYLIGSISEKELENFRKLRVFESGDEIGLESLKDADLTNIKVVIVISPDHKDEIKEAVAALKGKNAEYCYYLFFMNSYKIASWILRTLDDTFFADDNGNTIKLEQCPATFFAEFVNARDNTIVLEKGFFSVNLHILCTGSGARVNIEKYTTFKNCTIECGNGASIKIGSYSNIDDKCEILCGNDNFYLVDGQNNTIEAIENKVTVNEHVKIGKNTTLVKGADIGSGAVIAPCSVVDSNIPPCSLASGNRAAVVRSNVSWASDKEKSTNLYDIKDRTALKYFTNKKTVFIHGSCVSRNSIDYSSMLTIKYYLFQNPIHTIFFKGIEIDSDKIEVGNNSQFLRKTYMSEFNKSQLDCIKNNVADYYVMDISDINWGYYESKKDPNVRLYGHFDIYNTLKNNSKKIDAEFIKKEFEEITMKEWTTYIDKYIDIILRYYSKSHIIFIRVPVVKGYTKSTGEYVEFDKNSRLIRFEPLLRKLEDYIINTKLSGAKIIEVLPNVMGDGGHDYGASPLHYKHETYLDIVYQIDEYVSRIG